MYFAFYIFVLRCLGAEISKFEVTAAILDAILDFVPSILYITPLFWFHCFYWLKKHIYCILNFCSAMFRSWDIQLLGYGGHLGRHLGFCTLRVNRKNGTLIFFNTYIITNRNQLKNQFWQIKNTEWHSSLHYYVKNAWI